jgi:hypothetical protein
MCTVCWEAHTLDKRIAAISDSKEDQGWHQARAAWGGYGSLLVTLTQPKFGRECASSREEASFSPYFLQSLVLPAHLCMAGQDGALLHPS